MTDIPGLYLEESLWQKGFLHVCGVDEAGRGAWAGPVMAGAVVLPKDVHIQERLYGVRDSKQMTPAQREHWAVVIKNTAIAWAVGVVSSEEIDQIGILPANRLAMQRAIEGLSLRPIYFLFDFIHWKDCPYPGERIAKGEKHSLSIASASVIAKTERDAFMCELDRQYPGYQFGKHKGYGTALHREAIQTLGSAPIHRKSFNIYQKHTSASGPK